MAHEATAVQSIRAGIARGELAIAEGRTMSHADAARRLQKWLAAEPSPASPHEPALSRPSE